jgi:hypothetical protein
MKMTNAAPSTTHSSDICVPRTVTSEFITPRFLKLNE